MRPVANGKAGISAVRYRKCQGRGRKTEAGNPEVRMSEACAFPTFLVPVAASQCQEEDACGRAECECTAHSTSHTAWQNLPR